MGDSLGITVNFEATSSIANVATAGDWLEGLGLV